MYFLVIVEKLIGEWNLIGWFSYFSVSGCFVLFGDFDGDEVYV